ncbi:hypothetical protein C7378_1727 [Acidipila rosea]|uniref:Uncharacterized protein n=1 Tax=Acidipila rosea TaxID=768535 RepID=A0A4R1L9R5_9BACT|nr:hypothetical protein C7378_1727 [Acidipila rosea]
MIPGLRIETWVAQGLYAQLHHGVTVTIILL